MKKLFLFGWMLAVFLVFSDGTVAAGQKSSSEMAEDLPLPAGLCVNRVSLLIRADKPEKAVAALIAFQAKAKEVSPLKAKKRGYTHYYIDFLLGNSLMMLERKKAGQPAPSNLQNPPNQDLVQRAAQAYQQAVDKNPALSQAWLNLAQCRYRLEERAKAARAFVRGYDTADEKDPQHLYYSSACFYFAEHHRQALDIFYRLLADHRDSIRLEWKEILVNALFELDRNREALPWLQELARLSEGKKKKQWQEVLLYQYLTLEMDRQALDYAGFLTRTDPAESRWWKSLAHIHLDKNRMEKGLQSLMIYGFLTPLSLTETSLVADLFQACDIPLEAARYYENWLDQMTGKERTENQGADSDKISEKILRIASAYRQGGEPAKALAWAEKGLALGKDPDLLRLKADLLFQDKRFKASCAAYERLATFKSHRGVGNLMMGYAAWNGGQMETAARAFVRASEYPKQKKSAKSALVQVQKAIEQEQMSADL